MVVANMRRVRSALLRHARISGPRAVAHSNQAMHFSARCNAERLGVPGSRVFSSQPQASAATVDTQTEQLLAQSLANHQPMQALSYFTSLKTPPSQLLSQKLAILLAKRGNLQQTERAVDILKAVYMQPTLQPDDYTTLASIHVVDACLRHRLLDAALEIYEEAFNVGVTLDLPAYDALVQALVESDRLDEATELLEDISANNDTSPTERSYFPLLEALVERQDYLTATTLLKFAAGRGVQFTSETFHPLVEFAEEDDDATDSIVTFLSYVEQVWDEAKLLDKLADAMEVLEIDEDEESLEDAIAAGGISLGEMTLDDDDDEDDDDDDDDDDDEHQLK